MFRRSHCNLVAKDGAYTSSSAGFNVDLTEILGSFVIVGNARKITVATAACGTEFAHKIV